MYGAPVVILGSDVFFNESQSPWYIFSISYPSIGILTIFTGSLQGHINCSYCSTADLSPTYPYTTLQILGLRNLGYTTIFARSPSSIAQFYRTLPALVSAIMLDPFQISECLTPTSESSFGSHDDGMNGCLLSTKNPHGLPKWKLFSVSPPEVVSILAPELIAFDRRNWIGSGSVTHKPRLKKNEKKQALDDDRLGSFVGYSFESRCRATSFVRHTQRLSEAYVLSSEGSEVSSRVSDQGAWAWKSVTAKTGVPFVTHGLNDDQIVGINDLGKVRGGRFLDSLAQRSVLVGNGEGSS